MSVSVRILFKVVANMPMDDAACEDLLEQWFADGVVLEIHQVECRATLLFDNVHDVMDVNEQLEYLGVSYVIDEVFLEAEVAGRGMA